MKVSPDFRTQLREVRRDGPYRAFQRIPAGAYLLSVQASGQHHSEPRAIAPVEDYERWEVAVFAENGSWVIPLTHPQVFAERLWSQYWVAGATGGTSTGQRVPTEVVQTFYDFLMLGPDRYREMSRPES